MSKSFGQSFRIDKSHGILAMKVFCSWDFKVIKKTSVKLRSENICTQLRELLEETNRKHVQKTVCQRLGRVAVHGLAWLICIGSIVACVLALYYFSEYMHKDPLLKEASLLALPVVVSLINLLLPGLFNATAWMEEYDSPSVNTYVAISRNLMLKVSVLVVLCFHWLGRICWESFVGQELYRFLLMDFIFTILDTFFGEFLWRWALCLSVSVSLSLCVFLSVSVSVSFSLSLSLGVSLCLSLSVSISHSLSLSVSPSYFLAHKLGNSFNALYSLYCFLSFFPILNPLSLILLCLSLSCRLFSQRVLKRKRKPVFDISRNVLELIYGQTLAWYEL
uniref:Transmembrane channel-like protein n=1 Tax=Hucho hucho TaxID=62062 RepID=A0A4W5PV42_9TELE